VIMLPALHAARNAADDVRAMNNLRQLDLALIMYTTDHKGLFPPSVAYVGTYVGGGSVLQDPRVHNEPVSLPAGSSWVNSSAEVDSHFDFVYTGAGLRIVRLRNASTFIVMYDKPLAGHQRVVAFADGHVERIPQGSAQFARAVQATNQTRESLNLPLLPADLSGPP
jgi:prepilin-type processing-associated H-X9-DG protein